MTILCFHHRHHLRLLSIASATTTTTQSSRIITEMSSENQKPKLHIAMYPWFAMGHLTSFLHISNKLANRGHKISFFLPPKTQPNLKSFNLHPDGISFFPVAVPAVAGLPSGAETTADVPFPLIPLLMAAMDRTRPEIERSLLSLRPDLVFFDFTHWLPEICRELGAKSVHYCTVSPATVSYLLSPERNSPITAPDLMTPPPNFPPPRIKLSPHEARGLATVNSLEFGAPGLTFLDRQVRSLAGCDAIGFKTCAEMEGQYCDYVRTQFKKPVILAGPVVPEPPESELDETIAAFLDRFDSRTLIFCALGSECVLKLEQFHELVLGLELTGNPFLAVLKPPTESETIESALPEGFGKRVEERGMVYGGWVQQPRILAHAAVGCFVTHCGSGSLSEAMVSRCRMVFLPNQGDQIINARLMGTCGMGIGVEVERGEEDGAFTREGLRVAVERAMERDENDHEKWREFLLGEGVEEGYIGGFIESLFGLINDD